MCCLRLKSCEVREAELRTLALTNDPKVTVTTVNTHTSHTPSLPPDLQLRPQSLVSLKFKKKNSGNRCQGILYLFG